MIHLVKGSINNSYSQTICQEEIKVNFIKLLPTELILKIFSYLNANELATCTQLNKTCRILANDEVLWKASPLPKGTFGKEQWEKYFGDIGEAPPLSKDFYKIFKKNPNILKTHTLVLVPTTVNNNPLTLKSLAELVKTPKEKGYPTKYQAINQSIILAYGNQTTNRTHWVLMRKEMMHGNRNMPYKNHPASFITKLNQETGMNYEIPSLLDAITCIFMHYISSGECLFTDPEKSYTLCQEYVLGFSLIIGGFSSKGLIVTNTLSVKENISIALMQRFF